MKVLLEDMNTQEDYIYRQLKMNYKTVNDCILLLYDNIIQRDVDETRVVYQYNYISWPRGSTPTDGAGLIDLIDQVNRKQQQTGNKPIVVHCRLVYYSYIQ